MGFKKNKIPNASADTYQTGQTVPPKNYSGIIALLLVLIILLCGIITALGFMNVHLFRLLSANNDDTSLAFVSAECCANAEKGVLGICTQDISAVWCEYHHLPKGVYITSVDPTGIAAEKGVEQGDILISINTQPIDCTASLENFLVQNQNAEPYQICLYRAGAYINLTLIQKTK